jgi:hypothetical protein
MFSPQLRPEVREPPPPKPSMSKQTISLSVLRNSTYRLSVLSESKIVFVHIAKAYGGDGIAPLILSLDTRSVEDHAPTALSPRKPMVHSEHEAGWAPEPV